MELCLRGLACSKFRCDYAPMVGQGKPERCGRGDARRQPMRCGKANTTDRTVLRMQGGFLMPTESEGKVMKNNLILSDAIEQLVIENRTTGERIAVITHEDVFTASDNIVVRLKPRAD